jgi:hypothetical protein
MKNQSALQFVAPLLLVVSLLAAGTSLRPPVCEAADAEPALLTVPYKMPADAELTLGLFDSQGQLLRWIVQGQFAYAGDDRQEWDGLDQWGRPVPAGHYRLKAAYHAPLSTDYELTVCNPGNPPWPTADDKGDWLSDEADPQAVATDGSWVFLGAPAANSAFR